MKHDKIYISTYEDLMKAINTADKKLAKLLEYDVSGAKELLSSHKQLMKSHQNLCEYYKQLKGLHDSLQSNHNSLSTQVTDMDSDVTIVKSKLVDKIGVNQPSCISMTMLASDVKDAIAKAASTGGSSSSSSSCMGTIVSENMVRIDTKEGKIEFGSHTYIVVGDKMIDVSDNEYDIAEVIESDSMLWYDTIDDKMASESGDNRVMLGVIQNSGKMPELNITNIDRILVNGMPVARSTKWLGKRMVVLGDDYVLGMDSTVCFHEWLPQLCGFSSVEAYGVERSCITPKSEDIPTWEDGYQSFNERYYNMSDFLISAVIVWGGFNDWRAGKDLGTIDDTTAVTFCGALKHLINNLFEMYPESQIYFIATPQMNPVQYGPTDLKGTKYENNKDGINRRGLKLADYAKATVDVCAMFGIPCLDLYHNFIYGLSKTMTDGTYSKDGFLGNMAYHKLVARKVADFINNN